MEKKDLDYIDSELKKISIKDFEYQGNRSSEVPVFVFEHQVDNDFFYCIVLNGESKKVEIQSEVGKNGKDERIDTLHTCDSWVDAIKYLKNNQHLLVTQTEKKFDEHSKKIAKTARIAKKVVVAVFGNNPHYLSLPEDD